MKKKGSISEYKEERLCHIRKAMAKVMAEHKENLDSLKLFQFVVDSPAPRFYISEERAAIVVSILSRGLDIPGIVASRREMFQEIYRRYCALKKEYPDKSIKAICSHIIHSPAPKFYLTPKSAREFIFRNTRQAMRLRAEKL